MLPSLLSDPSWTAGAYSVQFDYFTDNFVPCSIVYFVVFSPHMLVGFCIFYFILFFCFSFLILHLCCFWFRWRLSRSGVCLCVLLVAYEPSFEEPTVLLSDL